jgi:uncharacterized LabA/DUF88 family protein
MRHIFPATTTPIYLQHMGEMPNRFLSFIRQNSRVFLFGDDSNFFYAFKRLGIKRNLQAYLDLINLFNVDALDTYIYMSLNPKNEWEDLLIHQLRRNNFQVFVKKIVERADGTRKGNVDTKIAWDMRDRLDDYDVAILVSGDGDFTCIVEMLKRRGKCVVVVGLSSMTSRALKNMADYFIDLEELFFRQAS